MLTAFAVRHVVVCCKGICINIEHQQMHQSSCDVLAMHQRVKACSSQTV